MARSVTQVILSGETYKAATSNVSIIGGNGDEHVIVLPGVTGLTVASNVESVKFDGHLSDYKFSGTGAQLNVFGPNGDVVAQIAGAGGKQVVFADGGFDVEYEPEGFSLKVEGQEVPNINLDDPSAEVFPAAVQRQFGWIGENTYISGGDTPNGFNIKLRISKEPNEDLKQWVANAAERISDFVVGDLPECNGVDDVVIDVSFEPFTHALGSAVYKGFRSGSYLPFKGRVEFSSIKTPDMEQERFEQLAMHEMLHVMGFGKVWEFQGLLHEDDDGFLRFTGPAATKAYNKEFAVEALFDPDSDKGVPVETDGRRGTARQHWDEAVFDDEIMTGWIDPEPFVSNMTIAALSDMGYEVII